MQNFRNARALSLYIYISPDKMSTIPMFVTINLRGVNTNLSNRSFEINDRNKQEQMQTDIYCTPDNVIS